MRLTGFTLILLLMTACESETAGTVANINEDPMQSTSSEKADKDKYKTVEAVILDYVDQEQGIDPYPVRMLVTKNHLRIDEGSESDNFLLYDRNSKDVLSVTHKDRRILKIPHRSHPPQNTEIIEFTEAEQDTNDMPDFAGKSPRHTRFFANGKTCYEVIAVDGVHNDAVAAIRGYLMTLAGEQVLNLNKTPVEFRNDCMLSNLIYQPVKHLETGLPLRQWDHKGYVRQLVNYQTTEVDASLFEFDQAYQFYQINDETSTDNPRNE